MREEYDFSKARKNPYLQKEKKQITINLNADVIEYFKQQAERSGIPYQTLINLYLTDCVANKRELGLPMHDAPNAVEELKQPRKHPTAEKVEAIKDVLRYFEMA